MDLEQLKESTKLKLFEEIERENLLYFLYATKDIVKPKPYYLCEPFEYPLEKIPYEMLVEILDNIKSGRCLREQNDNDFEEFLEKLGVI